MKVWSAQPFVVALPAGHRLPMAKHALLHDRVWREGATLFDVRVPSAAADADLLRVHAPAYLERVASGTLARAEQQALGLPWSQALVERARRSVGATLAAAIAALDDGAAANLAGGTHHAHHDRPGGYCLFNDCAVAARMLQARGGIEQVLIVDCDVHHGDGTASIFAGDDSVVTLSLYGARNYPARKPPGDIDVALADATGDADYLRALEAALARAFAQAAPQFVFYLAGADPYAGDRLGRLALSKDGLARRDTLVFSACATRALPVAVAMGGGYAPDPADVVDIHLRTLALARSIAWRGSASGSDRAGP
ncbi:MAG: histone deacetylase [Gammaproteobacteria bacterium]|nr:histone deacetylase [Gammaproteobacteria bacterium]